MVPPITTKKGRMNWLVRRTRFNCALVMVTRRSSCGLGRIEIRSSSDESQFTAFDARSPLPLKPRKRFAAQVELPVTTKRPCEFGLPVLYVPAAAIVRGPFLFLGSARLTSGELRLFVATLLPEESK